MANLSVTWTLNGTGWVDVTVADQHAAVEVTASYITAAPEDFLTAVARLVLGEGETYVRFDAEPTAFRWIFARDTRDTRDTRDGTDVRIRLLELPDACEHDDAGTELWSSRQPVDTVARAVIRCFDEVARTYGESGYRDSWKRAFPRSELEALRTAWRASQHPV